MIFLSEDGKVGDPIGWTTSLLLPGEHLLKKNNLPGTLPTLAKEWKVTFEFNPRSYSFNGDAQILHMTIDGKSGTVGERTPALWISKKGGVFKVLIKTALNGKPNEGDLSDKKPPPVNKWSKVEISQQRKRNPVGSQGSYYVFSLVIGGDTFVYEENNSPTEFSNVKVFTSSDWYTAQAGHIRGFKIENKVTGKTPLNFYDMCFTDKDPAPVQYYIYYAFSWRWQFSCSNTDIRCNKTLLPQLPRTKKSSLLLSSSLLRKKITNL